MRTTNMEMALAEKIRDHRQVLYKRDFIRENKIRLTHFADGLKLGDRKELQESIMKNTHQSFRSHLDETVDS